MIGREIIVKSVVFLPFQLHTWYADLVPLRCKNCGKSLFTYHSAMQFCRQCLEKRFLYGLLSHLTCQPSTTTFSDVECVVFQKTTNQQQANDKMHLTSHDLSNTWKVVVC